MLDLPRSVRLVTWAGAVVRGDAAVADAVRAVQRDDEPHTVEIDAPALGSCTDLGGLLRWVAHERAVLTVAMPVPGHLVGLPGPPDFNAAAVDAGECVLMQPRQGSAVGLLPDVTEFGSWLEPGALVTWRGSQVAPPRGMDLTSLSEAEQALREAMVSASDALASLDVARWREDAAERLAAVRAGGLDGRVVPGGTPPRALRVLAAAARVRAIVDLAVQDDGAAVNGWEATARADALRQVDHVARRAMVAAVNLPA